MKILDTNALENRLMLLESYLPYCEGKRLSVSKVAIAWHLDHSLKVINAVVAHMQHSDPALYVDDFAFLGKLLFKINFFPRGKAKAPKYVTPPAIILKEDIIAQLVAAREKIKAIQNLDKNAYFKHPLFGNINKARVLLFLNAHTNHHLKIVKSILK
jgi:hypothetical protein